MLIPKSYNHIKLTMQCIYKTTKLSAIALFLASVSAADVTAPLADDPFFMK